jgi:hypothetical protein
VIHSSLQRARKEIRSLSAGLGGPQLNELTLSETIAPGVRVHEHNAYHHANGLGQQVIISYVNGRSRCKNRCSFVPAGKGNSLFQQKVTVIEQAVEDRFDGF